jgi:peptide deformylase
VAEEHGQVVDEELDAEREARRRLALAQIRQYPDAALRMQAHDVEAFDDDLRRLVERMSQLMVDANGVGLAATQIGILRRVLVFRGRDSDGPPTAVVNGRIAERAGEPVTDDEGCLSLQGVLVPVERDERVTVEGHALDGSPLRLELEAMEARIAQHELDHLDGVLIIDRTTPEARKEALGILRPRPVLELEH